MARGTAKLTAAEIKGAIKRGVPIKLSDGGGLTLRVAGPGSGKWVLRYMLAGKAREMGLGAAPAVALADARTAAEAARREIAAGRDPIGARHAAAAARRDAEAVAAEAAAQAPERTFRAVAMAHVEAHRAGWKGERHARHWQESLHLHAFPVLGGKDVAEIGREDVLRVLRPIWNRIPETAAKLRLRIEAVLDGAEARGLRSGPNPAMWRGGLRSLLPPKSRVHAARHQPALPWRDVPAFVVALRQQPGTAALALRMAIATGLRTNEVLGAKWGEIDPPSATWTVPAARMKGRAVRDHRVPLSIAAREVLAEAAAQRLEGAEHVFPAVTGDRPLSGMAMLMLLRRMQGDGQPRWVDNEGRRIVPHGFRSGFRDWCSEATSTPREVAEASLGHVVGNNVERAYARSDLLEKRRPLLEAWGAFITSPKGGGEVVPLRRRAGG